MESMKNFMNDYLRGTFVVNLEADGEIGSETASIFAAAGSPIIFLMSMDLAS